MLKLIPLFVGLLLPLTAALADDFTTEAVEFCRSKGGSYSMGDMVAEGDKYCRQVTCKKTTAADGRLQIPDGATGPEANVEAVKRVCIAKSIVDGSFDTAGAGNTAGSASGSASGSGSTSGSASGSGSTSGSGSGSASTSGSGSTSGSASGVNSGAGNGGVIIVGGGAGSAGGGRLGGSTDFVFSKNCSGYANGTCTTVCYNECREVRNWKTLFITKVSGYDRSSCRDCMLANPNTFGDLDTIISYERNRGSSNSGSGSGSSRGTVTQNTTGVTLNPGAAGAGAGGSVIIGGANSGVGAGGTVIISGAAAAGAAGGVAGGVAGGIASGAGAGAGVTLPQYCHSTKQSDIEKCQEWMQQNKRFLCASSSNPSVCMGGADAEIMARYDLANCPNCGVGSRKQSTLSGVAEIIGAIAPPLAYFGSAYVGAKAYQRGQEAWAGAAAAGFEQCQISQNNYMQYLAANELPGLTPQQQAAQNCNGFGLSGYAGLQNPALGGLYGAGYTPGMIGGMMGPYGMYNPYGMGGMVGGAVGGIGIAGGYQGGIVGGIVGGGYPGGIVGGIQVAGGINAGGYPGGYAGGIAGGYPGGYAGGIAGGYPGGYAGGIAGGYPGGYAGGIAGGYVNGISIAGGVNAGGYPGGYAGGIAGGYPGGYAGGIAGGGGFQGGYPGGAVGGISIAGGYNGGMPGGYMAGGYTPGGYNGGYMAGGYNGGFQGGYQGGYAGGFQGGYAGGNDYGASQQAANYDRMMQQQGTSFQMGMGGAPGGYGGYGAAAYSPMNLGITLGGNFGIGGGVTW